MMEYKLMLLVGCLAGIVLARSGYTLEPKGDNYFRKVDDTFQSELELKVKVQDIKTESCYNSSEVELYRIPWKVQLCKDVKEDSEKLKVSLQSVFDGDLSKSSSIVNGKIQIEHKETGQESLKMELNDVEFEKANLEISLFDVKWSDFTDKYVKDGIATFKFSLSVKRPVLVQTLEHVSTTFQLRVFDALNTKGTKSPNIVLRGVKWYVWAVPYTHDQVEMFSVFVGGNASDMDINSTYNVKATIKLLSNEKGGSKDKTYSFAYDYHWRSSLFGAVNFIKMDDFKNPENKFIFEENALLEIKLAVQEPKTFPQ
ncbi:uncharacterized protein LOC116344137 [Contarinia nasturtii]|uniref:uncharacterized protein LOC116344137 n=1 Tax=Contarinia nasturtii TaxID=265458 RepID=UPI0012D45DF3|nr:uncharacterized protein LOC116344137 [Contarinia nasturtii]